MKVTLSEVKKGYSGIKKLAFDEFKNANYEKCLEYVDHAATLASQIMWRYSDDELEELLQEIGEKIIVKPENYEADRKKIVFYDYFGSPVILTLQYLRVLIQEGYEILYLYEERNNAKAPVVDIIKVYENVLIKKIALQSSRVSRIADIYRKIVEFKSSKIFLHINTLSVGIPAFSCLPKEIVRYYINLGDHAFWLGTKAIDYSFEFRSFGANVSIQKRGLKKNQLLLLPYYPIIDKKDFKGFPKQCNNRVVIFSGGDFYKTVDKENTYWNLVNEILKTNPKAIIIYANKALNSAGKNLLDSFIRTNNLEDRFIPIGFRQDINEVMKNCDIYLGTCPMSGGLMSQHAAINAKPILQFYPHDLFSFEETESMICYNEKIKISFTNKEELLREAKKLIENKDYRIERGVELQKCMITEEEFNNLFIKSITTHTTQVPIEDMTIKYNKIEQWWIEVNNEGYYDAGSFICSIIGKKSFIYIPRLILLRYINNFLKKLKLYH